jgi:hypothetical protein
MAPSVTLNKEDGIYYHNLYTGTFLIEVSLHVTITIILSILNIKYIFSINAFHPLNLSLIPSLGSAATPYHMPYSSSHGLPSNTPSLPLPIL